MKVKSINHEKENKCRYKILGSKNTVSFRTTENKVLKHFLDNEYYQEVMKTHNGEFYEYLKMLENMGVEIFTLPDTIYMGQGNSIKSIRRDFIYGNSLSELYPKTELSPIEKPISNTLNYLDNIPNIKLSGISPRDIIYTGDALLITNFDLCSINDEDNLKQNKGYLSSLMFASLFHVDPSIALKRYKVCDKELLLELINGGIDFSEYLEEYKNQATKRGESTKYIRSLKLQEKCSK